MILGAEIGLLIFGIYTLITGKLSVGRDKTLTGGKARLLGGLCLVPIPLAFVAVFLLSLFYILVLGQAEVNQWIAGGLEFLIVVATAVGVTLLGQHYYAQQEADRISAETVVEHF